MTELEMSKRVPNTAHQTGDLDNMLGWVRILCQNNRVKSMVSSIQPITPYVDMYHKKP